MDQVSVFQSYTRITDWQGRTNSENAYLCVKYDNAYVGVK